MLPSAGVSPASRPSTAPSSANSDCRQPRCAPRLRATRTDPTTRAFCHFLHGMRCCAALDETTHAPADFYIPAVYLRTVRCFDRRYRMDGNESGQKREPQNKPFNVQDPEFL